VALRERTRTASLRSSTNKRLFIPIKKGVSDLSLKAISTWICKTISLAYESSGQVILDEFQVKSHDVRALATQRSCPSQINRQDSYRTQKQNQSLGTVLVYK
jgi:hypothetical protein